MIDNETLNALDRLFAAGPKGSFAVTPLGARRDQWQLTTTRPGAYHVGTFVQESSLRPEEQRVEVTEGLAMFRAQVSAECARAAFTYMPALIAEIRALRKTLEPDETTSKPRRHGSPAATPA